MKIKIIGLLIVAVIFAGCDIVDAPLKQRLSISECDERIRSEYTNSIVTRLSLVNEDLSDAKWLVKTPDNEIIFFQRNYGELVRNKIF